MRYTTIYTQTTKTEEVMRTTERSFVIRSAMTIAFAMAVLIACEKNPAGKNGSNGGKEDEEEQTSEVPAVANAPVMIEIPEGVFTMGGKGIGEHYDEIPKHEVIHTAAFRISKTEITNKQYEEFDPTHKSWRGDGGFSRGDNEAVVNVTYEDATAYCEWLSEKTGKNYRLPTEAEWEYACRAGTTTDYYTGSSLPASMQKQQKNNRDLASVSLQTGTGTANSFGLYDMHGNVEEWCLDWYGPYPEERQINPGGPKTGVFRVTRGGSHNTLVTFLRSANRSAATPDDKHTMIGFRVVESDTQLNYYDNTEKTPRNMTDVKQTKYWSTTSSSDTPVWEEPIAFVVVPSDGTPYYSHNHQPAITWCDNGDLLAIWYSTSAESGREMTVVGSRLRQGATEWEPASSFFKVPDRNMTGSALGRLADGTLIHANGVGNAGEWKNLALCVRRSTDNGATWTTPVLVAPKHTVRHQVIAGPIVLSDGTIVLCCDAGPEGNDGTAVHLSTDDGVTWNDPWDGSGLPSFYNGGKGTTIAGIHAGIVELKDGSLMTLGRGNSISGKMPKSLSKDKGETWTYYKTDLPAIGSGQRLVLMRLNEGPIMLASFGTKGLYVSISEDEGNTWSSQKLMTDGKTRVLDGGAHTGQFTMTANQAEPKGYMACTQTPDGIIHLISSKIHYRFNLAWIKA